MSSSRVVIVTVRRRMTCLGYLIFLFEAVPSVPYLRGLLADCYYLHYQQPREQKRSKQIKGHAAFCNLRNVCVSVTFLFLCVPHVHAKTTART